MIVGEVAVDERGSGVVFQGGPFGMGGAGEGTLRMTGRSGQGLGAPDDVEFEQRELEDESHR